MAYGAYSSKEEAFVSLRASCPGYSRSQESRASKWLDWLHEQPRQSKLGRVSQKERRELAADLVASNDGAPRGSVAFLLWVVMNPSIWRLALEVVAWFFGSLQTRQ